MIPKPIRGKGIGWALPGCRKPRLAWAPPGAQALGLVLMSSTSASTISRTSSCRQGVGAGEGDPRPPGPGPPRCPPFPAPRAPPTRPEHRRLTHIKGDPGLPAELLPGFGAVSLQKVLRAGWGARSGRRWRPRQGHPRPPAPVAQAGRVPAATPSPAPGTRSEGLVGHTEERGRAPAPHGARFPAPLPSPLPRQVPSPPPLPSPALSASPSLPLPSPNPLSQLSKPPHTCPAGSRSPSHPSLLTPRCRPQSRGPGCSVGPLPSSEMLISGLLLTPKLPPPRAGLLCPFPAPSPTAAHLLSGEFLSPADRVLSKYKNT